MLGVCLHVVVTVEIEDVMPVEAFRVGIGFLEAFELLTITIHEMDFIAHFDSFSVQI